ncbi:hypothetical protein ACEQ8H_001343 [Pleosporales sp. CAS-2024a]
MAIRPWYTWPMDSDAKLRYFRHLVCLGYKEIEVSYPSASRTEFEFTRQLITTGEIPDDTWIQVMTPCREELIRTTIEAVRGSKKTIIHMHFSTSACFRVVVFNMTESVQIDLAVRCTKLIRSLTKDSLDPEYNGTDWTLEFTPENFQDTSVAFAVEICNAVKEAWERTRENRIIFNLTATVEVAMPNVFADQVESFGDMISDRNKVCISLHNHNDRGCAVAAAEMGQLAGADRVEGCLFGNGERTGNADLVTLALNLHTHGIDSGLDFSDINEVVRLVEELTQIPVHMRAPYAGKYTFCTFTGSHQDAIRKGYKFMEHSKQKHGIAPKWRTPFLPMDPGDVGRNHEAIIRLKAQSGKGGIGWYVDEIFRISMPRDLEIAFTKVVKSHANDNGVEITHSMIEELFKTRYMLQPCSRLQLLGYKLASGSSSAAAPPQNLRGNDTLSIEVELKIDGTSCKISGIGHDIITAVLNVLQELNLHPDILDFRTEHCWQNAETNGNTVVSTRESAVFVKVESEVQPRWGVGIHEDAVRATISAILCAVEEP